MRFLIEAVETLLVFLLELEVMGLALMMVFLACSARFRLTPIGKIVLLMPMTAWQVPLLCVFVAVAGPRGYRRWRARVRLARMAGRYEPMPVTVDL